MPYIQNNIYLDRAVTLAKSFYNNQKTALDWVDVQRPFTTQQKTN